MSSCGNRVYAKPQRPQRTIGVLARHQLPHQPLDESRRRPRRLERPAPLAGSVPRSHRIMRRRKKVRAASEASERATCLQKMPVVRTRYRQRRQMPCPSGRRQHRGRLHGAMTYACPMFTGCAALDATGKATPAFGSSRRFCRSHGSQVPSDMSVRFQPGASLPCFENSPPPQAFPAVSRPVRRREWRQTIAVLSKSCIRIVGSHDDPPKIPANFPAGRESCLPAGAAFLHSLLRGR